MLATHYIVRWSCVIVVLCALAGCTNSSQRESDEPATVIGPPDGEHSTTETDRNQQETGKVTNRNLSVSKANDAGDSVQLGVLQFDETNHAKLITEGSGPAVDQLKRDWQEVSNRAELTWKKSIEDTIDGEAVTRMVGQPVRPGDPDYIYAVLSTMERSYGYEVDLTE